MPHISIGLFVGLVLHITVVIQQDVSGQGITDHDTALQRAPGVRSEAGIRADSILVAPVPVSRFLHAVAISKGSDGRIYVVDAGSNRLTVLSDDGTLIQRFGSTGTDEGEFDAPTDVDPGNGLGITVSDAGNARIQRFSRDFRFLESLPVSSEYEQSGVVANPTFRVGAARVDAPADGYPVAVATSREDDLYAIDASTSRVYRWDRDRRNMWVISGSESREGSLEDPVDLAISGDNLYVADAGRSSVIIFDIFGTYLRTIGSGQLEGIRSIKARRERLWIALADRVLEYDLSGLFVREAAVSVGEDIVDIELNNEYFLILTPTRLLKGLWLRR